MRLVVRWQNNHEEHEKRRDSLRLRDEDRWVRLMYIGKLAKLSGATPKAIRLYEAMGLIPVPSRQGQYRVYSLKDVSLVHMIRRAQAVGFSLAELKPLVALKAKTNQLSIEEANRLIARKREKLRNDMNKIMLQDQQLMALHEELNRISKWESGASFADSLTLPLGTSLMIQISPFPTTRQRW